MKRMILVLIVIFVIQFVSPLFAQLTDEQKSLIQIEIGNEIQRQTSSSLSQVREDHFRSRNKTSKEIAAAIKDNKVELATQYFDFYAGILDTLVISNPIVARKVIIDLQSKFEKLPSVSDRLLYYIGAANYFLFTFDEAENNLMLLLKNYPNSQINSKALTLLLKTYINASKEKEAAAIIDINKATLNEDQKFLAGHIYFSLDNNYLSTFYFTQITTGKYKDDAEKMLTLLSAFNQEPQKAIDSFAALLKTEPDNPFVILSLARLYSLIGEWKNAEQYYSRYIPAMKTYREIQVQYELATTYLNMGDKVRSVEVLNNALNNKEMGNYVSPLFYLWSDIVASTGQANDAKLRTTQINQQIVQNKTLLQSKIDLLKSVDALKSNIENKLGIAAINKAIEEINVLTKTLDSLDAQLNTKPFGISQVNLNRWQIYEKQSILSFLNILEDYIFAYNLKSAPDTLHINQLVSLEKLYSSQIEQLNLIKESLYKLNDKNLLLAIRNEIDNNVEVLEKTITNLNRMKTSGQSKYSPAQLDTLIASNERKKVETAMLRDYYDFDNSVYKFIMAECDSSIAAANMLIKSTPSLKAEFQKKYPTFISNKEKKAVSKDLSNLVILVPEYVNSISSQMTHLNRIGQEIEFIDLHIAFIETNYYDKLKKDQEKSLSYEDLKKLLADNQVRKQQAYDRIRGYVDSYKDFPTEQNPVGFPDINVKAGSYFALAELSNSLWQDKPGLALASYRKVFEFDPKFYLSDAVLYNIGYLSSIMEKSRIESGISAFELKNPASASRPDSLRYTEKTYSEAILAYKRIASEYKSSQYYSEALFRLGYLYFEIGTNADRPVEYYQIARSYYDPLVNNPSDPYRYKALYQRGWTWLNSSSEEAYNSAMDDFVSILKAINEKAIYDSTEAIDYSIASLKNIGYSLIGLDGSDINAASKGAEYAKQTLSKEVIEKDLNSIIDEAIQQKLKLYQPMQAIDFMNAKIELNPLALENPIIADSICTMYQLYPSQIRSELSPDSVDYVEKGKVATQSSNNSKRYSVKNNKDMLALENPIIADSVLTMRKSYPSQSSKEISPDNVYFAEKGRLTTQYGMNSDWYNANKNKDISKQLVVIKRAYKNLESHKNNLFVDNPNSENFKSYVDLIDQYSAFEALHDEQYNKWIEEKQANIIALNLKLAQITKNPLDYLSAAKRIYAYNDKYPENSSYFNLEGAAYDVARIVNDSLSIDINELKYSDPNFTLPLSADSLSTYYDLAAQRVTQVLLEDRFRSPQNDNLYINVILRQAEISRDKKRYAQASEFYQKITSFTGAVSNEIKRSALINLAEIADITKNYAEAENWYRMAENYGANTADKDLLHQYALLQIQNSIDRAKENKDSKLAGEEYLRLANEYTAKDPNKSLQYKAKAQGEYLAANQFQKSIDLLIEMSKSTNNPKDVMEFYRFAWSIADSLGDSIQADSLKQAFIGLYPSSNEAYQLRLAIIDKKTSNPATVKQAGDMYLSLYNDVIAKKIDNGNDNPVDLYLAAIGMNATAGDELAKETLAEQFVNKYPNDPSTVKLMEYLADRQLAKGDSTRYEQMSKTIFQKDKTSQSRYTNLAKDKLKKIASEFNKAYLEKNWQLAFNKRDEFKKVHTGYEKEGLTLDFAPVYTAFTQAETEYDTIQERLAFFKQFDAQLTQIENGFIKKSPDELLRVNINTKWKTNLAGGNENRIQALKNMANAEAKKVKQVMESGTKYNLEVNQRLRGFELICRIYEHGSDVIKTQVDKYMTTTTEFNTFKKQFEGAEDELYSSFNAQKDGHSFSMIQMAYPYYLAMYKYFYVPGYSNKYTVNAYNRLKTINALPRYRIDALTYDQSWKLSTVDLNDSTKVKSYDGKIEAVTSPQGMKFSQLSIPANHKLIITKSLDAKTPYDYAIANVVTPYYNDSRFILNNEPADYSFNPIDTLKAGEISTTRYAMTFGDDKFISGKNEIVMHYYNFDTMPMNFDINLMVISDSAKIEAAMPIDTVRVNSDETWEYTILTSDKPLGNWKKVQNSTQFGLAKTQWYEMETSLAGPIWVNQSDAKDSLQVVFRKELNLDGVLKEGFIKFIAPDVATIKLNDKELSTDYQLNYDAEANLVFAGQVSLTPAELKQGKNTLQIIVNNKSQWKGMVTEIQMTVARPE